MCFSLWRSKQERPSSSSPIIETRTYSRTKRQAKWFIKISDNVKKGLQRKLTGRPNRAIFLPCTKFQPAQDSLLESTKHQNEILLPGLHKMCSPPFKPKPQKPKPPATKTDFLGYEFMVNVIHAYYILFHPLSTLNCTTTAKIPRRT